MLNALRHLRLALLGWREAFDSNGQTFDRDPYSPRSRAYDFGRRLRRRGLD